MTDLTLVTYVSPQSESLAALLAEVFGQCAGHSLELIAVDGGSMRVDFDKVDRHCRERGIGFSVLRQDPLGSFAPGFHAAALQAQGQTLVFLNPGLHIPPDFLSLARQIGAGGYVVVPRPWMNVVSSSTECWGFWAPPDGMSIIFPTRLYGTDLTSCRNDACWESSAWPKADAYLLAAKMARQRRAAQVGLAPFGGVEYRRWLPSSDIPAYMPVVEFDLVDLDSGIWNERDIRRWAAGEPFVSTCEPIPPYRPVEDMAAEVRGQVESLRRKYQHTGAPGALQLRQELDQCLDRLVAEGKLVVRPLFSIEFAGDTGSLRVQSTGNVVLPHEFAG